MKIYNRELVSLCTFARELNKLGFFLKEEDESKFVFERSVFNDAALLYKNLTLVATANYKEIKAAFNLAFNTDLIEDAEIEFPLQEGECFVDLINRLNRITQSFQKSS